MGLIQCDNLTWILCLAGESAKPFWLSWCNVGSAILSNIARNTERRDEQAVKGEDGQ